MLTIPAGATLTIPNGTTLTNNGMLVNDGTITGTIGGSGSVKQSGAAVSGVPTVRGTPTANSITVNAVANAGATGQMVEYAISTNGSADPSTLTWQSGETFSSLSASTAYYVYARTAENANYMAGAAQMSAEIRTAPLYAIALDTGDYAFPGATKGYGSQTAKTVTVTNTGNQATGDLTVALSGDNAFTLSSDSISDIAIGSSADFTVTPKTGLAAATYTATVTVSGGNGIVSQTFGVRFTVNPAPPNALTGTAIISNPAPRIGDTLTGSLVGGNNTGTLTYQWKAGGTSAGTGNSYTVQTADLGKTITLEITSSVETGTRTSTATAAVVKKSAPATSFAITFNANGGKIGKAEAKTKMLKIKNGKAIGKPPTAKRPDYKFTGWYTKKAGGKKITAKTRATKNTTVYAHWRKLVKYGKVVGTEVFVRSAPAAHSNSTIIVGYMKAGQTFKVRAYYKGKAKNDRWYVLTYKGKTAYMYAKYVKVFYR